MQSADCARSQRVREAQDEHGLHRLQRRRLQAADPVQVEPQQGARVPRPGAPLRDNFDANSNVSVIVQPTTKKTITDYGSPEEFLAQVDYLLGKQAYAGKTDSEVRSYLACIC